MPDMAGVGQAIGRRFGWVKEEPVRHKPWVSETPSDLSSEEDAFEVGPIVDGLVSLIRDADPPFTLSLSGSWGVGKSTIAEAVVNRIRKADTPAVLIDLWSEDVANLRRTLVIKVGAALTGYIDPDEADEKRQDIAKELDGEAATSTGTSETGRAHVGLVGVLKAIWHEPVTAVVLGLLGLALLAAYLSNPDPDTSVLGRTLPGLTIFYFTLALVQSGFIFVTRTATTTRGPAERSVVVAEAFRKYVTGKGVENPPRLVLVVVDNLDRLPGEDAVKALSEIRALVEVKGSRCIFLIPVDRDALAGHIKGALEGSKSGVGQDALVKQAEAAKQYLDKFFNLDLLLTEPAPVDIRDWALRKAEEVLPKDDPDDVSAAVQTIVSAAGNSPRAVKRIINGVSSRCRLLGSTTDVSLAQIAFVESLLTQFPGLLAWMNEEPRHFVTMRERLAAAVAGDDQTSALSGLPDRARLDTDAKSRLIQFLITNRDIELSVVKLALVLTLRSDSQWRGVTEPSRLRDAVAAGDPTAFRDALEATPDGEKSVAVLRAIEWIERSAKNFWRDAVNGVIAVVDGLPDLDATPTRLPSVVVQALAAADDANRARVTPTVATFALQSAAKTDATADLADGFARTLEANPLEGGPGEGLIRAVQLGAPHLSPDRLEVARRDLAKLPEPLLTPLFEPEVDVTLVAGPVAHRYAQQLAASDLTNPEPAKTAAERLVAFRRAGGGADGEFTSVAVRLTEQLRENPGELGADALALVTMSPEIVEGLTGDTIDTYATALAGRNARNRAPFFNVALDLGIADAVRPQVASEFDSWIANTSATAEMVREVVERHEAKLTAAGSTWPAHLRRRWVASRDEALARLVAECGPADSDGTLVVALREVPADQVGPLADNLAGAFDGQAGSVALLVAELARIAGKTTSVTETASLAPATVRLRNAHVDVDAITQAIGARAASLSSPADVRDLVIAAAAFDAAGVAEIAHEADGLAERSAAVGVADLEAGLWLARRSRRKTAATTVLTTAIRSTTVPLGKALGAARDVRWGVQGHSTLAMALVERARDPGLSDDQVREVLEHVSGYKRQPAATRDEYNELLSQIAQQRPDLDELINRIKASDAGGR